MVSSRKLSSEEVNALMELLVSSLNKELSTFQKHNIQIQNCQYLKKNILEDQTMLEDTMLILMRIVIINPVF